MNVLAETDSDKAESLQDFFSSVYTIEPTDDFENLPSMTHSSHKSMTPLSLTEDIVLKKLSQSWENHLDWINSILEFYMKHVM